jgi:hypothetical protein
LLGALPDANIEVVFAGSQTYPRARLNASAIAVASVVAVAAITSCGRSVKPSSDPKVTQSSGAPGNTLLDQMNLGSTKTDQQSSVSPATDAQLAKQFSMIAQEQHQLDEIKLKASMAQAANQADVASQFVAQAQLLVTALNLRLDAFQKDLMVARQARPQDAVVQGL